MKKIVVYTAISNGYDILEDPKFVSENCDYICFTDDLTIESGIWELRELPGTFKNETLKNRYVKILPHNFFSQYEYSIYIDGNIKILGNIEDLVNKFCKEHLIATFKHPERKCVYQEAKECKKFKLDIDVKINKQMKKYQEMEYPSNNGLIYGGIIIRRHNNRQVKYLMEKWWDEVTEESKRDQLSFNVMLWECQIQHNYIPDKYSPFFAEKYFKIKNHINKKETKKSQLLNFVRKTSFGNELTINLIRKSYSFYKTITN